TAADYKCELVVFPEYFTVQLLTLGNVRRPISEQIRDLAGQLPRFVEMMERLAKDHHMYILAGTIPAMDDTGRVVNRAYFFGPTGEYGMQGKLHVTRFEDEDWKISSAEHLRIFETSFGRVAITICYDVEFPEV